MVAEVRGVLLTCQLCCAWDLLLLECRHGAKPFREPSFWLSLSRCWLYRPRVILRRLA